MRLSRNRAVAIRDFMIKCGADMNQFECTGYGGTQPLGSSPELNRRVEIRLLGEDADDTVTDTTIDRSSSTLVTTTTTTTTTRESFHDFMTRGLDSENDDKSGLDQRVRRCLMILGDIFSWYAVLRFPNDIYSMAVSSLKECLVDCGWLGDDSPITMTVVQQLLRTFSVRSMPGATEVFFGTFVELLNAISFMEVQGGVSAARSYKSNSIAIVLKNYMSRKQSSSISRTALNAQSRRVLSYFVTFVEERIVPKAWKRNPVPRHVFMQVGKLDRSVLRVLQTLFMNFANRTSNDGGMYVVFEREARQFQTFTFSRCREIIT